MFTTGVKTVPMVPNNPEILWRQHTLGDAAMYSSPRITEFHGADEVVGRLSDGSFQQWVEGMNALDSGSEGTVYRVGDCVLKWYDVQAVDPLRQSRADNIVFTGMKNTSDCWTYPEPLASWTLSGASYTLMQYMHQNSGNYSLLPIKDTVIEVTEQAIESCGMPLNAFQVDAVQKNTLVLDQKVHGYMYAKIDCRPWTTFDSAFNNALINHSGDDL